MDTLHDDDLDRRTLEEEEEAAAQSSCSESTEPVVCLWNNSVLKALFPDGIVVSNMIIATHRTACVLMNHLAPKKQVVGTCLLPEANMRGNRAVPTLDGGGVGSSNDAHCLIYAVPPLARTSCCATPPDLFVSCQWTVAAHRATAMCRALLAAVCAERVVVLSALPADAYRGPGDPTQDSLLFAASTTSCVNAHKDSSSVRVQELRQAGQMSLQESPWFKKVPVLPSGVAVGGLPAAVLSYCQMRGIAATLLLNIHGPAYLEALELLPLATALSALAHADGWGVRAALDAAKMDLSVGFRQHIGTHL